jgi:Arc/MetJ-type ribon-helix-helix transcriptional regulator
MKVKTSVSLTPEAIEALDRIAGPFGSRSQVVETAVLEFDARRQRALRDARDRELIDQYADALNAEMSEVLDFQSES